MRKFAALAGASLLAVAAVGQATAADLIVEAPAEIVDQAAFDWSGMYVGGQVGYVFGTGVVDIPAYAQPTFDVATSGWLAGVHAGGNAQFDSVVLGVEADANWISASGSALSGGGGGELYVIDQTWDASLRVRLGYAAENFLLYGTAGVAITGLATNFTPIFFPDETDTPVGWTAGVGAEYAFTDQVSGRVEYRYTDYATANFGGGGGVGPSSVDYTTHAVSGGLSFHF